MQLLHPLIVCCFCFSFCGTNCVLAADSSAATVTADNNNNNNEPPPHTCVAQGSCEGEAQPEEPVGVDTSSTNDEQAKFTGETRTDSASHQDNEEEYVNGHDEEQESDHEGGEVDEDEDDSCFDDDEYCEEWASSGDCDDNPWYMQTKCPYSCGLCGGDGVMECRDRSKHCRVWSEHGECELNEDYMSKFCPKSCFVCRRSKFLDLGVEQVLLDEDDKDGTDERDKVDMDEIEEVVQESRDYVENVIWRLHEYRSVRRGCKFQHEHCAYWAAMNECEGDDEEWMSLNCAPACQTCEMLDIQHRCPLDPDAPQALKSGDLHALFERLTSDPVYKERYHINILSQPTPSEEGAAETATTNEEEEVDSMKGQPWVISMENFLTDDECDQLVELGSLQGYARSVEVGTLKDDGSFDDKESKERTSENAWCSEDCYKNATARLVMDRIAEFTGIPETNQEELQLLRYEVGQFYGVHHDYIENDFLRQQGVRLLTFFLYLNDVEEGGGTHFPELDLIVQPKKGSALLWPSVLNEDPNEKDDRTDHEALAVTKGIKYGANAWIHMRDFKTPNRNGCSS